MIKMRYPYQKGNDKYDGQEHEIEPIRLCYKEINGRHFFIMDYKDKTLRREMTTLLEKRGTIFYKIPLSSYGADFMLFQVRFRRNSEQCDTSILPSSILTRDIQNLSSAIAPLTATAAMVKIFYNYADGNYYWSPRCLASEKILGAPDSLGKRKGDMIEGKGATSYKIFNVTRNLIKNPNAEFVVDANEFGNFLAFVINNNSDIRVLDI